MSRRWLDLSFPAELTHESATRAIRLLAGESRPQLLSPTRPLAFELDLSARRVRWRLGADDSVLGRLEPGLHGVLPGLALVPTSRPVLPVPKAACELKLRSALRPLDTSLPELLAHRLLAVAGRLGKGERVLVQWLVSAWLPRAAVPPASRHQARTIWNLPEWGRPQFDSEQVSAARKKLAEPLFAAVGRVAVWSATTPRARALVGEVTGSLQLLRAPGVGFSRRWLPAACVAARLKSFQVGRIDPPCRLMASELAAVIGWPIGNPELPGICYAGSRVVAPDDRSLVPVGAAAQHRVLGESAAPGRPGLVVLPPCPALRHLHVLGPTGSGKSWLLANLIVSDIAAGRGVVVVDAKGDLVSDVLARLPERDLSSVAVFDPSDDAPLGFNPLSSGEVGVDGLVHVMKSVWSSSWGPRLGDVLHAASLTLARSPGHSLAELPLLLTDAAYRRPLAAAAAAADPVGLGSFWAWYEALSEDARLQVLGPVMNKLRSFLLRGDLRAVLAQGTPRFDLSRVFTDRQSLLVRLGRGRLGADGAQLLGSLLVTTLWQAALARSALPATRRQPVVIYLDEFQEFLRLPIDLADTMVQARGLGVGLVLAHQHLGQLDQPVRSALLANAGSRVAFRLDIDDAAVLARRSGELAAEDFAGLDAFHAYASVLVDGAPGRYASIRTRPLPAPRRNERAFSRANQARFGVPRTQTEARLRELVEDRPARPAGPLGGKRRPGGTA